MVRPLGGFLVFLSVTALALGPYLYLSAIAWPRWIQPFPEIDGTWGPVDEVAVLAFILVDFGMSTAFVQAFARHRAGDPARALRAAQLYVWWELAGGLLLFGAGGAIACGILPHTRYALFSRALLLRSLLQVPGLLALFTTFSKRRSGSIISSGSICCRAVCWRSSCRWPPCSSAARSDARTQLSASRSASLRPIARLLTRIARAGARAPRPSRMTELAEAAEREADELVAESK